MHLRYIGGDSSSLEGEQDKDADPEDRRECRTQNIFWVPPETLWTHLNARAKESKIGQFVDDAMSGIQRHNPAHKGMLTKDYALPSLDNDPIRSPHRFVQQHQGGRWGRPVKRRAEPRELSRA